MIVGLCGKSCSGKDTLLSFFDDSFFIIDVDALGHKALEENKDKIASLFGNDILKDDSVDRHALSKIVFNSEDKLQELESITHPWMKSECIKRAKEKEKEGKIPVINCALLERMGLYKECDVIVFVSSNYSLRAERAFKRNGTTKEEFEKRNEAQKDIGEKIYSHNKKVITIFNNGSFEDFSRQAERICAILKKGNI